MKLWKTQQGMSLVSVLVAIGLTGVLAAILMNLSEQQNKQHEKALVDSDLAEILGHFRSILTNAESCNASFMNKKKGQDIYRLLLTDNATSEPFAEVSGDTRFRGSKLLLTKMKILTDTEVNSIEGKTAQAGVLLLEATFQKPSTTLGGKQIKKHFEFRALYGREEKINDPIDEAGVVNNCKATFGPMAFIKDLETGEKAVPEEEGVIPEGNEFTGMCVYPDETHAESAIIHCITAK